MNELLFGFVKKMNNYRKPFSPGWGVATLSKSYLTLRNNVRRVVRLGFCFDLRAGNGCQQI